MKKGLGEQEFPEEPPQSNFNKCQKMLKLKPNYSSDLLYVFNLLSGIGDSWAILSVTHWLLWKY